MMMMWSQIVEHVTRVHKQTHEFRFYARWSWKRRRRRRRRPQIAQQQSQKRKTIETSNDTPTQVTNMYYVYLNRNTWHYGIDVATQALQEVSENVCVCCTGKCVCVCAMWVCDQM